MAEHYGIRLLRAMARKKGIRGFSRMKKAQLLEALGLAEEEAVAVEAPAAPPPPVAEQVTQVSIPQPPGAGYGAPAAAPPPLPQQYGQDMLVLVARDPEWLFAWWDISGADSKLLAARLASPRMVLRVEVEGNGSQDLEVGAANNWYIRAEPARAYAAVIGYKDAHGGFHPVARSRRVRTPRVGVSWETDEEWMLVDEAMRRLLEYLGRFPLPGSPGPMYGFELHKLLISSPGPQTAGKR